MILAIDPGTTESAWVVYDGAKVVDHGKEPNDDVLLRRFRTSYVCGVAAYEVYDFAIEMVASYGMAVGAEVFHTVLWAGRFYEAAVRAGFNVQLVYRKQVAMHVCRSMEARDANVRAALIDRFGGKAAAIGKKKSPGPLHGLKKDEWQALGVAVTAWETKEKSKC